MGKVVRKVTKPIEKIAGTVLKGAAGILGGGSSQQAAAETAPRRKTPRGAPLPLPPDIPTLYKEPVMPKEAISPKEAVRGEGEGGEDAAKRTRKRRGRATGARGVLGEAPTARKTLLGG